MRWLRKNYSAFIYKNNENNFKEEWKSIFNTYLLGGIELLHERIIWKDTELDNILDNLYNFIELYNTRFYLSEIYSI